LIIVTECVETGRLKSELEANKPNLYKRNERQIHVNCPEGKADRDILHTAFEERIRYFR
jgi:hypothetical protein